MPKKKRKTISQAAYEWEQKQKHKKRTKLQQKIKSFKKTIDTSLVPRYNALESQFQLQIPKSKRKTVKKKKPQTKYFIYKGKAYPIFYPKKQKRRK